MVRDDKSRGPPLREKVVVRHRTSQHVRADDDVSKTYTTTQNVKEGSPPVPEFAPSHRAPDPSSSVIDRGDLRHREQTATELSKQNNLSPPMEDSSPTNPAASPGVFSVSYHVGDSNVNATKTASGSGMQFDVGAVDDILNLPPPRLEEIRSSDRAEKQLRVPNRDSTILPDIKHVVRSAPTPLGIQSDEREWRTSATDPTPAGGSKQTRRRKKTSSRRQPVCVARDMSTTSTSPTTGMRRPRHPDVAKQGYHDTRCRHGTSTESRAPPCHMRHFAGMNMGLLEQAFAFADEAARFERLEEHGRRASSDDERGQADQERTRASFNYSSRSLFPRLLNRRNARRTKSTYEGRGHGRGFRHQNHRHSSLQGTGHGWVSDDWVRTGAGVTSSPLEKGCNLTSTEHRGQVWSESHLQAASATRRSLQLHAGLGSSIPPSSFSRNGSGMCKAKHCKEVPEISLAGTTGLQRSKEELKAATATEMVQRFETGSGVAVLRAELEESKASMKRSTEALGEAANRWQTHNAFT